MFAATDPVTTNNGFYWPLSYSTLSPVFPHGPYQKCKAGNIIYLSKKTTTAYRVSVHGTLSRKACHYPLSRSPVTVLCWVKRMLG